MSEHCTLESHARLPGMFSRMATSLVQNPVDAFQHTCQWVSLSRRERRLKIVNCGDFCGDLTYILANLATPRINLPQLLNWLNLEGCSVFCLPFNKLALSPEMVSGTRGRRFKSSQARHIFNHLSTSSRRFCRLAYIRRITPAYISRIGNLLG